ncbi:MAG: hypothetical protein JO294_14195 [Alphaproteobacteria bacterium]|nr:hypothetical protein [Alphaproteobacteria bacterium]
MDILGTLLGTGTSAMTGGLFGLVGNIATKVVGYFEQKQAFTQKQAEWLHEVDLLKLQMQVKAQETESEIKVAESQGSWSGLAGSLTAEGAIGASYPWVNAVRALTRPTLTVGLSTFLAAAFFAMNPGDIDRAYVADSLVFAAVTAIVWWFGDRAPRKPVAR